MVSDGGYGDIGRDGNDGRDQDKSKLKKGHIMVPI